MRKFAVLLGLALLVMTAQLAIADPINPFNTRPVNVGSPDGSELSLQSALDKIYNQTPGQAGYVSATANQQSVGMWGLNSQVTAMLPILQFEYAGNANTNSLGLWYASDSSSITKAQLFSGPDSKGAMATVNWNDDGSMTVVTISADKKNIIVNTYDGIPRNSFGFYMDGPDGIYYSVDQLNGGSAQVLAYQQAETDRWVVAFEDQKVGNGHVGDYNDAILSVESITPVPEPASLALLGSGLVSLGGLLRRKRS